MSTVNTYTIEYRTVIEGTIEVEAETAQAAEDMFNDGRVDVERNGDRDSDDTEIQDTFRTDGTAACDTCEYDEDECICEYCETCDRLVEDCECEDEDEEDE